MEKVSKYAILSCIIATCMATASAIDFGGMLANDSKFTGNAFSELILDQRDDLSAWLHIPLNEKGTTYFATEGLFQFERKDIDLFNTFDGRDSYNASALDISLFKFVTTVERDTYKLTLSAGRFFTTDITGIIFSQNADGVLLSYETALLHLSAYGAYTGLLNLRTVSMIGETEAEDYDKLYQLAAKYAIGSLSLTFPTLFANQTIGAQFLGTFHLEDETNTNLYVELGITGPLFATVYYAVNTTLGLSKQGSNDMEVANLTKGSVQYYAPFANAVLSLNGVFASGNGNDHNFTGFTSQTAVNALSGRTEYTNLLKTGLSASLKPVQNVLVGATADVICNTADSFAYEGFQYGLSADYQVVSDASVGVSMYQYFDKDDDNRNKSCVQLKAAIAF